MSGLPILSPPGQLELLPMAPGARSTSYRVVHIDPDARCEIAPSGLPRWSEACRDLPTAALRAAAAAAAFGEAWLVAADFTTAHIDATGVVSPQTGWALVAHRVINQRKAPSR